jgi:hypothetical protein
MSHFFARRRNRQWLKIPMTVTIRHTENGTTTIKAPHSDPKGEKTPKSKQMGTFATARPKKHQQTQVSALLKTACGFLLTTGSFGRLQPQP